MAAPDHTRRETGLGWRKPEGVSYSSGSLWVPSMCRTHVAPCHFPSYCQGWFHITEPKASLLLYFLILGVREAVIFSPKCLTLKLDRKYLFFFARKVVINFIIIFLDCYFLKFQFIYFNWSIFAKMKLC